MQGPVSGADLGLTEMMMSTDDETNRVRQAQCDTVDSGGTDVTSILDAVDLPIVLTNCDRRIIRFNRAAATVLRLTPSDIGCSPSEILPGGGELDKLCETVVADGTPCRREIRDGDRCFLIRIAPCDEFNSTSVGAVLTFTNVTAFRASIDQAIYEREYTKVILNTVIEPLVVLDKDFRVQTANRAFYAMFGLSRDETQSVPLCDLGSSDWRASSLWESLNALSEAVEFHSVEVECEFPAIGRRTLLIDARRLSRQAGAMLLLALNDITERKRAEEALRQRTAQFQTLLNEAPLGVYLVDSDFRIREMNPTAVRVFGDISNLIGRDFDEVIHILWPQAYADELVERFRHTLATGEAHVVPERVEERRDLGRREYYHWQISRIPLPEGGYGVVCYFLDISHQVLARDTIAESEQRFRMLVSVITNVLWTADTEGRFVVHQPSWSAYTGQRWEELRDFGWIKAIHQEDRPQVRDAWERARETGTLFKTQGRLWNAATQRYRHFEARATPVINSEGIVREWVGSCTDVDERESFENALRKSEERLRFVAESMPAKIFTTRSNGDVDYFNHQWVEFTGFPFEEIKNLGWTRFVHSDDINDTVRLWQHSLDTGDLFQFVHRFRRADGSYRWHLSRIRPMPEGDGTISMWIGSSTDIHEEKEIEEQLRRANDGLNQFAFAASHDLQEPLRMITSYSELLISSYQGQLEGDAAVCVNYITDGTRRMRELLAGLLSFTTLGAEDGTQTGLVDLNIIFKKITQNLKIAIDETSAVVASDPLPEVRGQEAHFIQLFQNLVGNAIKYRSERPPVVRVCAESRSTEWLFSVADNGVGIASEHYQRVFGVFKRLHGREIPGTGIGLAICQRIVESYGGRIWIESKVGSGTTLYFALPRTLA
jgi:PAS domain S-box-containing protein